MDDSPQDPLPDGSLLNRGDSLTEGTYYYVVGLDGALKAAHESVMFDPAADRWSGHTSLSGGEGVFMAGTFKVGEGGAITQFDAMSGHYKPGAFAPGYEADPSQYMSLSDVTRKAFVDFGLPDPGEEAWSPFEWKR